MVCEFIYSRMNMYNMIATLDLNLKLKVPPAFIKIVFESVAQISHGLNFAHQNGLIHGNLDLSAIVLKREGDLLVYKLTGFEPVASKPLGYEQKRAEEHKAPTGPLPKSGFTPRYTAQQRRMEEMKYKDIYSLGIAILEMMIGRFSHNRYSITIEDIPSTWSDLNESSTLIQVLLDSLHFDQLKKQRLQSIRNLLIQDMRTFYKVEHFKMEQVMSSNTIDVFNKRAVMHFTHNAYEDSELLWTEGNKLVVNAAKAGGDLVLNYSLFKWVRGEITDQKLLENLEKLECRHSSEEIRVILGVIYVGLGLRKEGVHQMKRILSEEYSLAELSNPVDMQGMGKGQNATLNNSKRVSPRAGPAGLKLSANRLNLGSSQSGRIYSTSNVIESPLKRWKEFEKLAEQIQLNNHLVQNAEITHGHSAGITGVHVTNTGKHFAMLSEDNSVSIWQTFPFKLVKRLKIGLKKDNFTRFNALALDNKLDYLVATFENFVGIFFAKDDKSELEPLKVLDVQNPDEEGIRLRLQSLRFFGGPEETSLKLKILKRQLNPEEGTQPASQFNAPFAHIEIEIDKSGGKILKMNAIKHELEEKSIFRYGLNYVNYFTHLREVFEDRVRAGDTIVFPEQKFELMIGLRKPNPHENAPVFYKYHVFNDQILRLIEATGSHLKKPEGAPIVQNELVGLREQEEELKEKVQDSKQLRKVQMDIMFDVAVNGSFVISCEKGGDKVRLQSLEVPRQLAEYMKPLYMFSMDRVHALNPAKLLDKKLKIGEDLMKLYKDLKQGLSGTSKVKQKEVKKMAVEMYNILQNAFSYSVNLISQNFQFLIAYRTFMLLYGHRADKEIGQFYKLYSLNSIEFKNSMEKIRYFHSSQDYDKTNVYVSFDSNVHIYNMQRNKIINLPGVGKNQQSQKVVRGIVVLPDDKSVICAETYAVRAYNRPHLNPNSKKKPHWQVLREDEVKIKISHMKLANKVIFGNKPHKYLPLFIFADGTGWRVFNALEVMNPTNLAEIGKPMGFQKLGKNERYRGFDVDFLKKGTLCVVGCSIMDHREHFILLWDFVKENELMRYQAFDDEVIKLKCIQEDRVLAIAQGNNKVGVWHLEEQKTTHLESDLIGTHLCTNLEVDKSKGFLFVGIRNCGIEIWNVSQMRMGVQTPPVYVRVFRYPLASFQLDTSSSMLTLLPVKGREVDFQLIQWKFKHLKDALANGEATFDEEAEQGFRGKTACCAIF